MLDDTGIKQNYLPQNAKNIMEVKNRRQNGGTHEITEPNLTCINTYII